MPDSNLRTSEQLGIGKVASIPPDSIGYGMTDQPFPEGPRATIPPVAEPLDLKPVLWQNAEALMRHRWGKVNLTRLARESQIGPATVTRMQKQDTSIGVDVLAAVAHVLGVHAWQLLVPDIDPSNLPRIDRRARSPQAHDLASTLDRVTDPTRKQQAYATALAVIALAGESGGSQQPPLPGP